MINLFLGDAVSG